MINDDSPFDWAERLKRDADDESLAARVRVILACAGLASLIVAAGVVAAVA